MPQTVWTEHLHRVPRPYRAPGHVDYLIEAQSQKVMKLMGPQRVRHNLPTEQQQKKKCVRQRTNEYPGDFRG